MAKKSSGKKPKSKTGKSDQGVVAGSASAATEKSNPENKSASVSGPATDPVASNHDTQKATSVGENAKPVPVRRADASGNAGGNRHDQRAKPSASAKVAAKKVPQNEHYGQFLRSSGKLLSVAAAVGILMILFALVAPQGMEAIRVIGGVSAEPVAPATAKWAILLDIAFPLFYGSGLALMVGAYQTRGNRPLVRVILTALMLAVLADFAENAVAYSVMSGSEVPTLFGVLTFAKYGLLAWSGILLSVLIPGEASFGKFVVFLLRYLFPISIAVIVSGVGGDFARHLIGALFPVTLIVLSVFVTDQADKRPLGPSGMAGGR